MNNKLGTLSWMERSGGKLSWRDRLALTAQGVQAMAASRKQKKSGLKVRFREVDEILPPDTPLIREAFALCQDASAPFLLNHCLRAYFWARLLDDGATSFDDEALFAALLLHDMGLTDGHRLQGDKEQCFTIVGARMADQLARKHGWADKRAYMTANAITLHLNVSVGHEHGREAQLVRMGSGADVAGLGLGPLEKDQINAVTQLYPRLDLKNEFIPVLNIEAEQRPCCRIAFLNKKMGFSDLIRHSQFGE